MNEFACNFTDFVSNLEFGNMFRHVYGHIRILISDQRFQTIFLVFLETCLVLIRHVAC